MLLTDEHIPAPDESEMSDDEVLARSVAVPSLFGILVNRYQDALLRRAQSIVRDPLEAEDIVQEVFTKVYLNARRYRPQPGATVRSWLYKILMNTTFSHYQRLKKKGALREELDPEVFEALRDPRDMSREEIMRDYVASVFSRMPTHLARVLRLHLVEEYSQKEIADMEGASVSAIKTRVYRAKREFERLAAHDTNKHEPQ
jgi:RNA polymerase sigma-70 factor (ECF subfamily)